MLQKLLILALFFRSVKKKKEKKTRFKSSADLISIFVVDKKQLMRITAQRLPKISSDRWFWIKPAFPSTLHLKKSILLSIFFVFSTRDQNTRKFTATGNRKANSCRGKYGEIKSLCIRQVHRIIWKIIRTKRTPKKKKKTTHNKLTER
jgi:hypothetical protein